MNQVKRYDKNGKLIEILSPEKLSQNHWAYFNGQKYKDRSKRGPTQIPGSDPEKRSKPIGGWK